MTGNLKRVRWGVRAVLILGVAASVTGNVLHADDKFIAQAIAAWAPLALLLTIELIARVPVHRRALALARWAATALIAGIAAWVSYWHMAAVASEYGETAPSNYLLPLSVDGLIVVASICLVELGGRIRTALEENGESNAWKASGDSKSPKTSSTSSGPSPDSPTPLPSSGSSSPLSDGSTGTDQPAADRVKLTRPRKPHPTAKAQVEAAHKRNPKATHEALAKRLNLTPSTVKRYRPKPVDETPLNGHAVPHMGDSPAKAEKYAQQVRDYDAKNRNR